MRISLHPEVEMFSTQREDLSLICRESHFANFSEMGAGKSLPHAILAQGVIEDGICDRVFIIAPKIVLFDWFKIFKYQIDCDWRNLVRYYHAPKYIRKFIDLRPIIILSYETIMEDMDMFMEIASNERCMIVIDEAHRLRNHDSGRTEGITALTRLCKRVYLLTGTPITNGLKNAFSYINILRPDMYYNNFKQFKKRHMRFFRGVLKGYRGVETVQEILDSFSVRHLKKEMLDLPPVTFQTRRLDWEPKQKIAYKQLVNSCTVDGMDFIHRSARLTRLHQIVTNPQQLGLDCDSTRWKVINEDLESIDTSIHKVVILCHYQASIKRLKEQLKQYNPAVIYGGTSDVEKQKEKFNWDDTCRVMIAHPLSAGVGVNFTVAAYMIFFEYSWDLDSYDQTVSRCNRPGQIYPLTVINYAVKGGMEERKIIPRLVEKKAFATSLLQDPEEFIEFITLEDEEYEATVHHKPRHAADGYDKEDRNQIAQGM